MSKISTISSLTTITNPDNYSWPITINGGMSGKPTIVTFGSNLTLTGTDKYFIIGSGYVTIDGLNNTVTIDSATDYLGLVQNGSAGVNGFTNITIQNIKMSATNSTIADDVGAWICQAFYGYGLGSASGYGLGSASNLNVNNVHTDATCNGSPYSGLICGQGTNYVICTFCSSKGSIGTVGGGIFASNCSYCEATDCFSTGTIGDGAGGIFGQRAGSFSSATATNCYSLGSIRESGGGIYGQGAGNDGSATATNCYSLGAIGESGGGIYGSYGGQTYMNDSIVTATNCYSRGTIGTGGGGIYGASMGYMGMNTVSTVTATNCYSLGTIGTRGGGIYGADKINGTETNCYAANNNWNYSTAANELTGDPTYDTSGNLITAIGTVWTDISYLYTNKTNIPWELTSLLNISVSQTDVNDFNWPVQIDTSMKFTFTENIVLDSDTKYFNIQSDNVEFSGPSTILKTLTATVFNNSANKQNIIINSNINQVTATLVEMGQMNVNTSTWPIEISAASIYRGYIFDGRFNIS